MGSVAVSRSSPSLVVDSGNQDEAAAPGGPRLLKFTLRTRRNRNPGPRCPSGLRCLRWQQPANAKAGPTEPRRPDTAYAGAGGAGGPNDKTATYGSNTAEHCSIGDHANPRRHSGGEGPPGSGEAGQGSGNARAAPDRAGCAHPIGRGPAAPAHGD